MSWLTFVAGVTFAICPAVRFTFVASIPVEPIVILALMQVSYFALGCFTDAMSMLMITLPIYMPIVNGLGLDPVLFGILTLLNLEVGTKTPPFGFLLFCMKGVAPKDTTMADVYLSVAPFVLIEISVIVILFFVPGIATWVHNLW